MLKPELSPGWYIAYCSILDVVVGTANLHFNWFNMEYVSFGFITLLALPLLIPRFGRWIGLHSSPFWK